jgi:multiple sugar transport system substrate-binding protein
VPSGLFLLLFLLTFGSAARTLTVMCSDRHDMWQPLLDAYMEQNPGTTLEYLQISGGKQGETVIVRSAGGVPPDVALWMLGSTYVQLAHNQLLAEISSYIDADELSDLYAGSVDLASYQGRLYGLPVVNGTMGILYNVTLFEESGLGPIPMNYSWDDFVTFARRITRDEAGDGLPSVWGLTFYQYLRDYMNFVWINGGDLFDRDRTRFLMNEPAATEALQSLADVALVHNAAPRTYSGKAAWTYWYEGLTGMYPVGSWGLSGSRTRCEFDWEIAPFPTRKAFTIVNEPFISAVTSGSKQIDESVRLLKWLVFDEAAQAYMSDVGLGIPAQRSIARRVFDDPTTPQNEGIFLHMLNSGLPRIVPYTPNWADIQGAIHTQMAQVFAGDASASHAMNQVAPVINNLLQGLTEN